LILRTHGHLKRVALALVVVLCGLPLAMSSGHGSESNVTLPAPVPPDHFSAAAGEELVYEVSWWIVKLGTIRMRVTGAGHDSGGTGGTGLSARADIDTYDELPFTSLHAVSETVTDSAYNSLESLGLNQDGDAWRTLRYRYAHDHNALIVERGTTSSREDRGFSPKNFDTLSIGPEYQDGLSIFYFARAHLKDGRQMTTPTVIEGRLGRTLFDFSGESSDEEIEAVDYPIDVVRFSGTMEFSGIYGLTGPFEGWFSNDDARVPIRANMEVMLGSVKIELVGWHRSGWSPPRRPED
jgi:hypothetical protein